MKSLLIQARSFGEHGVLTVLDGLAILSLVILFCALLLRRFSQPYFIACILSGIVLGPDGFRVLTNQIRKSLLGMLVQLLLRAPAVWLVGFYVH